LASERGRNAAWAEKAVRESLSLTAQEALERKVVEIVAEDRASLFEKLEGRRVSKGGRTLTLKLRGAPVTEVEMGAFQKILHILANPNLAYLFLMIGVYGLIYEFSSPGVGFGAVVGFVSLALAAYSLSILPVNYAGLLIVGLGVVLLVLETQIASHGLLSIGGLTLLALGSLFLFDSAQPFWRVSRPLIAGTVAGTAAFFGLVVFKVVEARRRPPSLGPAALVGRVGEAREALDPRGLVFVDGELWSAESDRPIRAGAAVVVREVRGMLLKVDEA
jgi:membrane-bound serine protease (ClpP class)